MLQQNDGEGGNLSFPLFQEDLFVVCADLFFSKTDQWICDTAGAGGLLAFEAEFGNGHKVHVTETMPKPGDFIDPNEADLIVMPVMLPGLGFHVFFSVASRIWGTEGVSETTIYLVFSWYIYVLRFLSLLIQLFFVLAAFMGFFICPAWNHGNPTIKPPPVNDVNEAENRVLLLMVQKFGVHQWI